MAFLIVSIVTAVITALTVAAGSLVLIATNPIGSRSLGYHLVSTTAALGLPESAAIWLVVAAAAVVFTLAIAAGRLLAGRVLRPLGRLAEGAQRVADGDLDVRLVVDEDDGELADLVRTFNTMTANLDRSIRELRRLEGQSRRFVADVSHELRTPLTAMTAVTDVLRAQVVDPTSEGGRAVDLVVREVHHLDQLVDDLIEISRFDAGIARIDTDVVDVEVALRACLERRGWSEQVEVVMPSPVRVEMDRRRFDVVVSNLVGNALKYGAPPVTVTAAQMIGARAASLVVTVEDCGPGIDEDALPHVFDRFFKSDGARTRSDGSGLGLAIARENARLHGGDVAAENRAAGGARFMFTLPNPERTEPPAVAAGVRPLL